MGKDLGNLDSLISSTATIRTMPYYFHPPFLPSDMFMLQP